MIQITEASRDLSSPDARFIVGTWLHSYRAACSGGSRKRPPQDLAQKLIRKMDEEQYNELLIPHVHGLVMDRDNELLIMSLQEDRDLYVGWACGRRAQKPWPAILHYVYVKQRHRREGNCHRLLKELLGDGMGAKGYYTCQTWEWFQVILDASGAWSYLPKLATKGEVTNEKETAAEAIT